MIAFEINRFVSAAIQAVKSSSLPLHHRGLNGSLDVMPQVSYFGELREGVEKTLLLYRKKVPHTHFLSVMIDAGDRLTAVGEWRAATELFYSRCKTTDQDLTCAPSELALYTRARYGHAICVAMESKSRDPNCRSPASLKQLVEALTLLQEALQVLMKRAEDAREQLYWLVYNGTVHIFNIAEPLITQGFGASVVTYLNWCLLCIQYTPPLCVAKYLPWRVRIYSAICTAYEAINNTSAASRAVEHGIATVEKLRRLLALDPPVPPKPAKLIDDALFRLNCYKLKYDAIVDVDSALKGAGENHLDALFPAPLDLDAHGRPRAQADEPKEGHPSWNPVQYGRVILALSSALSSPNMRVIAHKAPKEADAPRVEAVWSQLMERVNPLLEAFKRAVLTRLAQEKKSEAHSLGVRFEGDEAALDEILEAPEEGDEEEGDEEKSPRNPHDQHIDPVFDTSDPLATFEASPWGVALPLSLHLSILRLSMAQERWSEFQVLLRTAEVRIEAAERRSQDYLRLGYSLSESVLGNKAPSDGAPPAPTHPGSGPGFSPHIPAEPKESAAALVHQEVLSLIQEVRIMKCVFEVERGITIEPIGLPAEAQPEETKEEPPASAKSSKRPSSRSQKSSPRGKGASPRASSKKTSSKGKRRGKAEAKDDSDDSDVEAAAMVELTEGIVPRPLGTAIPGVGVESRRLLLLAEAIHACARGELTRLCRTRPDMLSDAVLLLWRLVQGAIAWLDAQDPGLVRERKTKAEMRGLAVRVLTAIHDVSEAVDLDDTLTRGIVALRLSILLREAGDPRRALQVRLMLGVHDSQLMTRTLLPPYCPYRMWSRRCA